MQPALAPNTNAAAARVLDRFSSRLIELDTGCCGAWSYHPAALEGARAFMRKNIDVCWPYIEAGAEAIVLITSGCGAHVCDIGYLLCGDPESYGKAKRFSEMTRGIAEILTAEWRDDHLPVSPTSESGRPQGLRIAFQSPCSLQYAVELDGSVEKLLWRRGRLPDPAVGAGTSATGP